MKRHILLFAFLLCSAGRIGAQDSGSNWIKTRTAISETGTTITDITYYNGLGLPSQTTNVRASVNGYNIVTPIVYDALLRSDATAYLPFEATYYSDEEELPNSTAISEQRNYYEERYSSDYERSFTEKVYEASPLGRVRKQALPGYMKDYEVLYTEFDYRTNDTDEVRWLAVGVDGELVCEGCHDAGTLSCTVTTDPDDHVVQSFTDGLGRTLLSRTFDDDEPIDTYSVYDDYGRLRWVVTPEGSYLLSDSLTVPVDDDFAEKYCYVYTYNDRGLMVEKRMPGREAEYMRYDEGDRLRVSQDGNLRAKKQWISYSYDALGRVQEQSLAVEAELIPIRSQAGVSIGEPIESVEPPYLGSSVPLRKYVYDTYPSEVQAAGLDFQSIEGLTATDGESLRYDNATGSLTYELSTARLLLRLQRTSDPDCRARHRGRHPLHLEALRFRGKPHRTTRKLHPRGQDRRHRPHLHLRRSRAVIKRDDTGKRRRGGCCLLRVRRAGKACCAASGRGDVGDR